MFKKGTGYSKACLVLMMLVGYNTCLGSVDVQKKELVIQRLV